jgi:alpha-beta hydrolase superfamily lysophospholipase
MADERPALPTWTATDGYVAYYRRYLPAEPPRAHIVCLHGIQSHGGWYDYSSRRLCQAGYAVWYLDRRGSGANRVDRGDASTIRKLLRDIADFIREVVPHDQPVPIFLSACSWGGKLGVAFCRRHPGLIDGLILLSPGMFPRVAVPFLRRLRIFATRLIRPRRRFPIPLNDPALFTATEPWRDFIRHDELALHEATARFLVGSSILDIYLIGAQRWVNVPALLMLAEHDQIIDITATRRYVESFRTRDKEIIEYAGAHHTLEFEPDPDRFIDDLITWLRNHERLLLRQRRPELVAVAPVGALNLGAC